VQPALQGENSQRFLTILHTLGAAAASGIALAIYAYSGSLWSAVGAILVVAFVVAVTSHRYIDPRFAAMALIQKTLEALTQGETPALLHSTELGELAGTGAAVNRVIEVVGGTRDRLGALSQRLTELPAQVDAALQAVLQGAEDQEGAVEETASLQANINTSIKGVTVQVERLAHSNEESASSILELGSAIEQVARSAASLQETIEGSTSSLHQVGESIRTVANSTNSVQESAEETAASITEMDRAIQEVGVHARGAADLTQHVSETAEEGGRAVDATIQGIEEIRVVTLAAKDALENLASRISEIDDIATVIGSITDETNLLSLNASIIAAQAGEHGKAFAVVAEQVKTLARRTSLSTREISQLIEAIQEHSNRAVDAMGNGIEAVNNGVERSRLAGEALNQIRSAAGEASGRVTEIAHSAEEQARNSKRVAEAARRSAEHVTQISLAMTEQAAASDQLLRNAEESVDNCRQMTSATEEQRASSQYITKNIEAITDLIRDIQVNTRQQEKTSGSVAETFDNLLANARGSVEKLPELAIVFGDLREQADALRQELSRFGV